MRPLQMWRSLFFKSLPIPPLSPAHLALVVAEVVCDLVPNGLANYLADTFPLLQCSLFYWCLKQRDGVWHSRADAVVVAARGCGDALVNAQQRLVRPQPLLPHQLGRRFVFYK